MWALGEEKTNRAYKHSFPHGVERFDIVRGTAAAIWNANLNLRAPGAPRR